MRFTVIDELRQVYSTFTFVLQKLRFDDDAIEFRLGYYVVGKLPSVKDRWIWGQFAPMIPADDFRALMDKARLKGWIQ